MIRPPDTEHTGPCSLTGAMLAGETVLHVVVDYIEETARRIRMYHINEATPRAKQFARIIQEQCEQLAIAVPYLEARKLGPELDKTATEVHRLENEADDLLA